MGRLRRYPLVWILLLALCLRLIVAFHQDAVTPYTTAGGGDEAWYLANGWGMVSGLSHGYIRGITFFVEVIPGAPAYLVMVGLPQMFLPDAAAVRLIFSLQAVMGTAVCFFACRTATLMTEDKRAGLLVALILAVSPVLVMITGWILTEPLYIFLTAAGIWIYLEFVVGRVATSKNVLLPLLVVGALFGLAVLTRAVLLLFPLIVALHLLLIFGRGAWRRGLLAAGVLLISYSLTVSVWTIYNLVNFNRFVIGSTQMMPALWRGAVTNDTSPDVMDSLLMPDCKENCTDAIPTEVYSEQITDTVLSNVTGFIGNRLRELASASLQPYGTAELGGESLRDLTLHWLREDFSLAGFMRLVNGDNFWLKLLLYLLHYAGMLLGLAGIWQLRRRWHMSLIPAAFIFYTYGLHLLLLALPRYIFPTQVYWWIYAGIVPVRVWDAWRKRQPEQI